jgi:hypothetical protein
VSWWAARRTLSRSWHSNGSSFLCITHNQSSASKGLQDPAKVGGLVLRKAVSLSFMFCPRGCRLTRALANVSSMRVWLWIICARSPRGGVVVVALLPDFLLGSGLLLVLPEEDLVQQAALRHQRLRGSGYGRPSRRSGDPSVDWVEWDYDYVMLKLFNSYIRQNLPSASSHNKQHTTNQHTISQTTSTNNFITARGYSLG